MGLLDALGGSAETTDRCAILLHAGPDDGYETSTIGCGASRIATTTCPLTESQVWN